MSRRTDRPGRGRLESPLSFMGPPQLGQANAPVRSVEQPVTTCGTCGQPHDEQEIVRNPRLTCRRRPSPQT